MIFWATPKTKNVSCCIFDGPTDHPVQHHQKSVTEVLLEKFGDERASGGRHYQKSVTEVLLEKFGNERASGGSQGKLTDQAQRSETIFFHSCLFPYY